MQISLAHNRPVRSETIRPDSESRGADAGVMWLLYLRSIVLLGPELCILVRTLSEPSLWYIFTHKAAN